MKINKKTGWIEDIRHLNTRHYAKRKDSQDVDLVVIHGISLPKSEFGSGHIDELFVGSLDVAAHPDYAKFKGHAVSAHILIDRKGQLTQYVSFYNQAWHAGISEFQSKPQCNEYSIGIELEGADDIPYEDVQYRALTELIKQIMALFPKITLKRIVGHCDVAPGRKTDPGSAFDWELLRWNLSQS